MTTNQRSDDLVERGSALATLLDALEDGAGRALVRGVQGVGRTGMCLELATHARTLGYEVALVRGALRGGMPEHRPSRAARSLLIVDDVDLLAAEPTADAGTFVVSTCRRSAPIDTEGAIVVDLPPLSFDGVERLLSRWLGSAVLTTAVIEAHRSSGGRPLWLREWVEGARRQGRLHLVEGVWTLTGDPEPTIRARELARWATGELSPRAASALVTLAAGSGDCEHLESCAVDELRAHDWVDHSDGDLVASVPWMAAALADGEPIRTRRRTVVRKRRTPIGSSTETVLRDLLDGERLKATDAVQTQRRDRPDDDEAVADAALSLGMVELWAGRPEAVRWFVEASLVGHAHARAAETGARMAKALTDPDVRPAPLSSSGVTWDVMPGTDPWLVNPVRAHAWELAAQDDPAAVRVLEEGAIDADARGHRVAAAMLVLDAALLDPVAARAVKASALLGGVPGPWATALRRLVDEVADASGNPSIRAARLGLTAEELADLGDLRAAVEGFRLAGNLARRAGLHRDAAALHERADDIARQGPRGWNHDLPEAVLALPPRQRQIVLLAARGRSNREIADSLTISPRTVENQLHRAFVDLRVEDRRDLRELVVV